MFPKTNEDKMNALKITAAAFVSHKPIIRFCDNTGKRLSEEQMKAQENSPYAGRVTIEILAGGRKLLEFNVAVFRGKSEMYAKLPEENAGAAGYRPAFLMHENDIEQIKKLAIRTIRTEKIEQVEL